MCAVQDSVYLRSRQKPSFTHVLTLERKEESTMRRARLFIKPWPLNLPTTSRKSNISSQASLCFVAHSLSSFKSLIMYQAGTFAQTLTCSTTERDTSTNFASLLSSFPNDYKGFAVPFVQLDHVFRRSALETRMLSSTGPRYPHD